MSDLPERPTPEYVRDAKSGYRVGDAVPVEHRYANGKVATPVDSALYRDSDMGKRSEALALARDLSASMALDLTRELGRRDRLDKLLALVDRGLDGSKLLSRTVLNIYAKYTDLAAMAESQESEWFKQLGVSGMADLVLLVARARQTEGLTEEQRADYCERYLERFYAQAGRARLRSGVERLGGEVPYTSDESSALVVEGG